MVSGDEYLIQGKTVVAKEESERNLEGVRISP